MSGSDNNDIETGILTLKNVLERAREHENEIESENTKFYGCLLKFVGVTLFTMIYIPFIVCNMYYGLMPKYEECTTVEPSGLITIRMYLVIRAFILYFVYVGVIIYVMLGKIFDNKGDIRPEFEEQMYGLYGCLCLIFVITWNIIGAIVFFGYIYPNYNCDVSFLTYMSFYLSFELITSFNAIRNAIKYRIKKSANGTQ